MDILEELEELLHIVRTTYGYTSKYTRYVTTYILDSPASIFSGFSTRLLPCLSNCQDPNPNPIQCRRGFHPTPTSNSPGVSPPSILRTPPSAHSLYYQSSGMSSVPWLRPIPFPGSVRLLHDRFGPWRVNRKASPFLARKTLNAVHLKLHCGFFALTRGRPRNPDQGSVMWVRLSWEGCGQARWWRLPWSIRWRCGWAQPPLSYTLVQ